MDDNRRVWKVLHENEELRLQNLYALKKFISGLGENRKTAKTLLKLIVYTGGVKASEAADIIGVKRELIDTWVRLLLKKNLVIVESYHHPNPSIRPTKDLLDNLNRLHRQMIKAGSGKAKAQPYAAKERAVDGLEKAVDHLEVVADTETGLDAGMTYLLFEEKPERSIKLFLQRIREGIKGMYVTRSNPSMVKKAHFLGDTRVVWLTSVETKGETDAVTGLQELGILINDFIDGNGASIVLLDGIEYLISNKTFPVVLKFVQQMRDKVSTSGSRMIIPLNPDAIEEKELSLLERECQVIN